eukprot:2074776-Pleurochrysis_carterae.AAC.1
MMWSLALLLADTVAEGSRHRKIYAPLMKCIFRQCSDIRRIAYFVGIALNVAPLAKVNTEEYYLAVNSNLNKGG